MGASSAAWRGLAYAFGRGLDPRRKDGVRAHPLVFVAGFLLHIGIFAAIVWLIVSAYGLAPAPPARAALTTVLAAGVVAGLSLLARRLRSPVLHVVSVPDDYASALLVVLFLATGMWAAWTADARAVFFLSGAGLAVYAPFSKIRHCILFFVTRARFGLFVARRGVLGTRAGGA